MKRLIQKIGQFFVNYDVFISVTEEDLEYANNVRNFLRKFGARVFVYKSSIEGGTRWREEIKENLKDCNYFIILLSSKSLKSRNVTLELGGAYFSDKAILPVLLENIDIKKLGMTDEFQCVRYNDSNFFSNIRNRMIKVYIKRAIFWSIIIGLFVYLKFKGN